MNLLIEAAKAIAAGGWHLDRYRIAAKLRRLEEVAGELDDGLANRIETACTEILGIGYDAAECCGSPHPIAIDQASHLANEITTAVAERIAAAVVFGRQLERENQ